MYTGAKTVVRTVYGNSNGFEVKAGMLVFLIDMEAFSREFRVAFTFQIQTAYHLYQSAGKLTHTQTKDSTFFAALAAGPRLTKLGMVIEDLEHILASRKAF